MLERDERQPRVQAPDEVKLTVEDFLFLEKWYLESDNFGVALVDGSSEGAP